MSGARVLEGEGAAGREGAGAALRWGACLVLVLGLHAGAAWLLSRRSAPFTPPPAASEAVMLELAPMPAPPAPEPPAALPSPDPMPDAEPPPPVEAPPPVEPPPPTKPPALPAEPPPVSSLPQPAMALPEPPPPMPRRPAPTRPARPPPRPAQASPSRPAPEVSAPSVAPASAPPPAAPAVPSFSAFPGWRSELSNRLQRAKRYPDLARARDEQGAAAVAFTVDRSGHVLSAKLVRSSGSSSLDEEAVAMVRRADPLPPMPADMPGSTATMTVPVTFSLR